MKNKSILDAIAANHTQVVSLIDGLAQSTQGGFNRVEARLERVEARLDRVQTRLDRAEMDGKDVYSIVSRIETKLDRHETRIEALEDRP